MDDTNPREDEMKMVLTGDYACEELDCFEPAIPCRESAHESPSGFYCPGHAAGHGYCLMCGDLIVFASKTPGLCRPCRMELQCCDEECHDGA